MFGTAKSKWTLVRLLVVVVLLAAPSISFADTNINEDFESYSAGGISGDNGGTGWTSAWTNYSGSGNLVATTPANGSFSMEVTADGSYRSFTSASTFDFKESIYVPSGTTAGVYIGGNSSLSTGYCHYVFTGGTVAVNGTSVGTYTSDAWVSTEIKGDQFGCEISIEGSGFSSPHGPAGGITSFSTPVWIQEGGTLDYYIDDITPPSGGGGGGGGGGSATSTMGTSSPEQVNAVTWLLFTNFVLFAGAIMLTLWILKLLA